MKHDEKFIRRRRFLMVLPVLVTPFITFLFWTLGGGKASNANAQITNQKGLNVELPKPQVKEHAGSWNKLSLYEKARRDSIRLNEAKRNDPYIRLELMELQKDSANQINYSLERSAVDSNEVRAYAKIDQIYSSINSSSPKTTVEKESENHEAISDHDLTKDMDRLQAMMEAMSGNGQDDPEMKQIENVLDKILDVQHPERLTEKMKRESKANEGKIYGIDIPQQDLNISTLTPHQKIGSIETLHFDGEDQNFYGLDDIKEVDSRTGVVDAVIHENQHLVIGGSDKLTGSTVKLRLLQDIFVNGILIPKDAFVYGEYSLAGARLKIVVKSIQYHGHLLPVSLSAYDTDGMEGLQVPGAIVEDVGRQTSTQALQNLQSINLDPSLVGQATSVGIEAVKSLATKKAKMLKVKVTSGYRILLKDNN